jgi:hypothetical protein
MTKTLLVTLLGAAAAAAVITQASAIAGQPKYRQQHATQAQNERPQFTFTDASGKQASVDVVEHYQPKKLEQPAAKNRNGIDPKLARAATIAQERANAHSRRKCWAYVKDALLASGAVSSRPGTEFAKEAGDELVHNYGFTKLPVKDPYKAPVGSVLVYTAKDAPGHVEIRTQDGFVSDFKSKTPSQRPLIGIFAKS